MKPTRVQDEIIKDFPSFRVYRETKLSAHKGQPNPDSDRGTPHSSSDHSSSSKKQRPILRANQPLMKSRKENFRRKSRRRSSMTLHLLRPVQIYNAPQPGHWEENGRSLSRKESYLPPLHISSGLTFDSGDQLLVSAQKPLGLILEEPGEEQVVGGCFVAEVVEGSAADQAGVRVGDILVAVQNADVHKAKLEEVLGRIGDAPRVVNLRFWRRERDGNWSDYSEED